MKYVVKVPSDRVEELFAFTKQFNPRADEPEPVAQGTDGNVANMDQAGTYYEDWVRPEHEGLLHWDGLTEEAQIAFAKELAQDPSWFDPDDPGDPHIPEEIFHLFQRKEEG